jgi:hypothetical protein
LSWSYDPAKMPTNTVAEQQIYEATLTVGLEPWARYFPGDWIERLASSMSTIHGTIWHRRPMVRASNLRSATIRLDLTARDESEAAATAETLVKRHTPLAGLMEGHYTIQVTSELRGARG